MITYIRRNEHPCKKKIDRVKEPLKSILCAFSARRIIRYFLADILDKLKHIFNFISAYEKSPAETGLESKLFYAALKPCAASDSTSALFSLPVRVPSLLTV